MGRGKDLTSEEEGKIAALSLAKWRVTDIAIAIGRSRHAVTNYLTRIANTGDRRKNCGKASKLSPRAKRLICKEAATGLYSMRQVRDRLKLDVSVEAVRLVVQCSNKFVYCKPLRTPWLTDKHKRNRLEWAAKHVRFTDLQWRETIFSDEKKFNLDGPDGMSCYWHDIRLDKRIRMSRQMGGGSVMVWAAFSFYGRSTLVVLRGKQKAEDYCSVLDKYLHPLMGKHIKNERGVLFQQDNAPIHTAFLTRDWLRFNFVRVMEWPARSPDLNPIENVWGAMVRDVYEGGKQYFSVSELQSAVVRAWNSISSTLHQRLVSSMPKRCIETLQNNGGKTSY